MLCASPLVAPTHVLALTWGSRSITALPTCALVPVVFSCQLLNQGLKPVLGSCQLVLFLAFLGFFFPKISLAFPPMAAQQSDPWSNL